MAYPEHPPAGREVVPPPARQCQSLLDRLTPQPGRGNGAPEDLAQRCELAGHGQGSLRRAWSQLNVGEGEILVSAPILERLAAFARAAAGFLEASGWRHLNHEDRVRIEAPDFEAELRCFSLLHHGAKPAPVLSFFSEAEEEPFPDPELDDDYDEDDYDEDEDGEEENAEEAGWTVALLKPWAAPPADVDLWEKHGLPWAGDRSIPVAGRWQGGIFQRPDYQQLALFEGLFAALTALAEGDLDTGPGKLRSPRPKVRPASS